MYALNYYDKYHKIKLSKRAWDLNISIISVTLFCKNIILKNVLKVMKATPTVWLENVIG
jgi:hypothetical protein